MKKHRKSFSSPALDWINDLSGKAARITSIGNRSLMVENHSGIDQYSTDCICLKTRCGTIRIEGNGLSLREVRKNALIVSGDIRHVDLPCEHDI